MILQRQKRNKLPLGLIVLATVPLMPSLVAAHRVRAFNAGGMSEYTEVVGAKTLRK